MLSVRQTEQTYEKRFHGMRKFKLGRRKVSSSSKKQRCHGFCSLSLLVSIQDAKLGYPSPSHWIEICTADRWCTTGKIWIGFPFLCLWIEERKRRNSSVSARQILQLNVNFLCERGSGAAEKASRCLLEAIQLQPPSLRPLKLNFSNWKKSSLTFCLKLEAFLSPWH